MKLSSGKAKTNIIWEHENTGHLYRYGELTTFLLEADDSFLFKHFTFWNDKKHKCHQKEKSQINRRKKELKRKERTYLIEIELQKSLVELSFISR